MAHFAKVNNGIVETVIVAEQDFIDSYIDNKPGQWIQTSYNTLGGVHYQNDRVTPSDDQSKALRKNYARIGGRYDQTADAFYGNKPYDSWILNTTSYLWEPPVAYPTIINDGNDESSEVWRYFIRWDEISHRLDNSNGWVAHKFNTSGNDLHADTNIYDWNGSSWVSR